MASLIPRPGLPRTGTTAQAAPKNMQERISSYLQDLPPEVPADISDILQRRKDALGGYESEAGRAALAPAQAGAAGAEQARQQNLAATLARQGVSQGGAENLRARLARQASQGARERARNLGIENIGVRSQLGQAYEQGLMQEQNLRNQRQFMNLATQLAGERISAAEEQQRAGNREAAITLEAMLRGARR